MVMVALKRGGTKKAETDGDEFQNIKSKKKLRMVIETDFFRAGAEK